MTVSIEQWQAGRAIEGVPPWDGTGFPFPFNADGSPAWPDGGGGGGGLGVLTLDPNPVPHQSSVLATVVTVEDQATAPSVWWDLSGTGWINVGAPMNPGADAKTWTYSWQVGAPEGDTALVAVRAADGTTVLSNEVVLTVSAQVAPPVTSLALTAPANAVFPDPIQATVTADVAPSGGVTIMGQYENPVAPGTWLNAGAAVATADPLVFTFTVGTSTFIPPLTVRLRAQTSDLAVFSPIVDVALDFAAADPNLGWTVQELRDFAADHEPPISIPSSATTKAQILQVILAYLAGHPEEN